MTVEVAIALVWKDGRLLLSRRPDDAHLGGLWEFPGGKLEADESPERAAEREVLEELRVTCRARSRRASIAHDYADRSVILHPVDCDYVSGEPRALEVSAFAWVIPAELGGYEFPEANAKLLAELAQSPPA